MQQFKVGDKVKCLSNYGKQFTKDKIYKIRYFADGWCGIEADDCGNPNGWGATSFELVKEETPQKQAALALPGILEFMEANKIKNMTANIGNYEINIKNNEK